jgi:adenine-specific DNA-methyltransferase
LTENNDVVLDFFAGSGTTAQAVMAQNAEDGKNRKFILVQLPEPTSDTSEAKLKGFNSIASITRARISNAAEQINEKLASYPSDTGFRAFKLTDTNFIKWRVTSDIETTKLEQHILNLRESAADLATSDALLMEILLKQGYSLTEETGEININGLRLKTVGANLMIAYLEESIKPSLAQLREVLALAPARFVILEDAFQGDDELKTNLVQECKSRNVELWTV